MAISIDYGNTNVITVPQADLTLVSGTLYELDTNSFRQDLKTLEASEEGIVFPDTNSHNTEVTVAGTTFARLIEILSPYSVEFTPDSAWSTRLIGSNNNIFDVENGILQQNQVQVIPSNSAGLQIVSQGSGLSTSEQERLERIEKLLRNKQYTDSSDGKVKVYSDDGLTVEFEADIYSDDGSNSYDGTQGIERRDRFETP